MLFPAHASLLRVLRMIAKGEVLRRFVTIPEGLTSKAAAEIVDATPSWSARRPSPPKALCCRIPTPLSAASPARA